MTLRTNPISASASRRTSALAGPVTTLPRPAIRAPYRPQDPRVASAARARRAARASRTPFSSSQTDSSAGQTRRGRLPGAARGRPQGCEARADPHGRPIHAARRTRRGAAGAGLRTGAGGTAALARASIVPISAATARASAAARGA